MSTFNSQKYLAALDMMEAFAKSYKAYYTDATPLNMAALQACEAAVRGMLEPYCREQEKGEK